MDVKLAGKKFIDRGDHYWSDKPVDQDDLYLACGLRCKCGNSGEYVYFYSPSKNEYYYFLSLSGYPCECGGHGGKTEERISAELRDSILKLEGKNPKHTLKLRRKIRDALNKTNDVIVLYQIAELLHVDVER